MLPPEEMMEDGTGEASVANQNESADNGSSCYNENRLEVLNLSDEENVDEISQTEEEDESKQIPREDPTAIRTPSTWITDSPDQFQRTSVPSPTPNFPHDEDLPVAAEAPADLIAVFGQSSNTYYLMTEEQRFHYDRGREWARQYNIGENIDHFFEEIRAGGGGDDAADSNNNRTSGGGGDAPLSCREEMRRNGSDL